MILRHAAIPNPSGIPHVYHPEIAIVRSHDFREAMKRAADVLEHASSRRKAIAGITSHPERRAPKYSGYACMVVVAGTPPADGVSKKNAYRELMKDLERDIYAEYPSMLDNQRDGGAGRTMPGPRFFVYICIREDPNGYDSYVYEAVDEWERRERAEQRQKRARQKNPVTTELVEVTGSDDPLDPWP